MLPLHRQPLFLGKAFGPYTAYRQTRPDLEYGRMSCPVAERACELDTGWLYQSVLLGTRDDMNDIAAAFEKVYEHRHELAQVPLERSAGAR